MRAKKSLQNNKIMFVQIKPYNFIYLFQLFLCLPSVKLWTIFSSQIKI